MSERVPEGWSPASFGDLAKVINGYAFQSSDFVEKSEISVPIIRMSSLKAGVIDLTDAVHVAEEKTKGLEKFLLGKGDFVFGMSGSISNFAIIKEQDGVCYQNQRVGRLSPINASREFVSQLFLSEGVTRQIEGLAAGGAQLNISSSQIENLNILNPPLPEQKKIASILTSVDEVIETTQKQIDKLQDLKKATMNGLLTKGIGHTEFKDSELGRIPKSWDETTFGNALNLKIIAEIQDGNHGAQHPKASEYTESGIPFVMARDLKDGQIDLNNISYIPETVYQKLRIGFASAGDVLLTHKATIGVTAVVQDGTPEVMCTPQVTYYRIGNGSILNKVFLFYWFQSDIFQNELSRLSAQSTRSYIGITAQKDLFLRLPPMDEQLKIIGILKSIDQKLKLQKEKLFQIQSLKKSLMQDLLTGKVRVQVN